MNIKNNDETLDAKINEDEFKNQHYQYYEQTSFQRVLVFYINEAINEPKYYTDMVHRIRTAGPNDVVYIHVNTPGGSLSTGIQLINAMHSSNAKIITVIDAEASSMGAILFLAGDEFIVNENCIMMFHHYSGGTFGKGHEQLAQATASVEWYERLIRKICFPFLSMEEIGCVLKGEDIWLQSDEIRDRLTEMVNNLNKQETNPPQKKKSVKKKPKK